MSSAKNLTRVAIVGGGVAGLAAARVLIRSGVRVLVFDKGRRPGGRISSRQHEASSFDHGASYFTVRSREFRRVVDGWLAAGLVERWMPRLANIRDGRVEASSETVERFVGVPSMSVLARDRARDVPCRYPFQVASLRGTPGQWSLISDLGREEGPFSHVVFALPAPQIVPLLPPASPLRTPIASAKVSPCHALMSRFGVAPDVAFDAAVVAGSPVAWLAREDSKPGRDATSTWVAHTTPEWSESRLDAPREETRRALIDEVGRLLSAEPADAILHLWRHARVVTPAPGPYLLDLADGLAACGDWCIGARFEAAWTSGTALGEALVGPHAPRAS